MYKRQQLAQAGANTWKGNNTGATANEADNAAGSLTEATSSVLTITGGVNALLNAATIQVKQATSIVSGYLSNTDWSTFNSKQAALTNPVTSSAASANAGQLAVFNGTGDQVAPITTLPTSAFPALTGDVTTTAGSTTTSLAASGATAGSYKMCIRDRWYTKFNFLRQNHE